MSNASDPNPLPDRGATACCLLSLAGAWTSAAGLGLVGYSLRAAILWGIAAALVILVASRRRNAGARWTAPAQIARMFGRPRNDAAPRLECEACPPSLERSLALPVVAAVLAGCLAGSTLPIVALIGLLLLTAAVARGEQGPNRRALRLTLESMVVLSLYRLALFAIPTAWLIVDRCAGVLGLAAGTVLGFPMDLGPTFAGLDFLVVMLYLAVRIPTADASPQPRQIRLGRIGVGLLATVLAHGIYLSVLSRAAELRTALPEPAPHGDFWTPYPAHPTATRLLAERFDISSTAPSDELAARQRLLRAAVDGAVDLGVFLRERLPWNLPVLALLLHTAVAWFLVRHVSRLASPDDANGPDTTKPDAAASRRLPGDRVFTTAAVVAAASLGFCCVYAPPAPSLAGKKIVFYEHGFLNWLRPKHGEYGFMGSIGMYGVMPDFLRSHGADPLISPDLSAADLADADVLVLIYPNRPWTEDQLRRIDEHVRSGRSLLLLGEHTTLHEKAVEKQLGSEAEDLLAILRAHKRYEPAKSDNDAKREALNQTVFDAVKTKPLTHFDEVLDHLGAAIRVNFDSSTFRIGGWLQSYETPSHPTTLGIPNIGNDLGVVIGASLAIREPARPLILGRWGWNDPGDVGTGPAMMSNHHYDAGERLGDVVLAAEQKIGRGRVIVFGDTSSFINGIMYNSHDFLSRLFAYLASPTKTAGNASRQGINVALLLIAAGLLLWKSNVLRLSLGGASLAAAVVVTAWWTSHSWGVHPNGFLTETGKPQTRTNRLVYIDESSFGDFSGETDRDDAIMGLRLCLMRDRFLTLGLPEITRERLLIERPVYVVRKDENIAGTFAAASEAESFARNRGLTVRRETIASPRARILIAIAPGRSYTAREQAVLDEYIECGGVFLCTVGYDRSGPIRDFLAQRGFFVGGRPQQWPGTIGEPYPLGHFKAPFLNKQTFHCMVRFHAGWPVGFSMPPSNLLVICHYPPNIATIVLARRKQGMIVVIGDTKFAANVNLENKHGEPFEGMRENAVFWRWFLSLIREGTGEITGREMWFPDAEGAIPEEASRIAPKQPAPTQPAPTQPAESSAAPKSNPAPPKNN